MKLDRAIEAAGHAAYFVLVGAMLVWMFPGARGWVGRWVMHQMWAYQLGVWAAEWETLPQWKRDALEARGRAPAGRPPAGPRGLWPAPTRALEPQKKGG